MKIASAALLLLVAMSGCATTHPDPSLVPGKMDISFGSGLGSYVEVSFQDDHLVYRTRHGPKWGRFTNIHPSQKAWKNFWSEMDSIAVWDWKADYHTSGPFFVEDGTEWSVAIDYESRTVRTSGYAAFPGDRNPRTTIEAGSWRFHRLLKAVKELTGRDSN